MLSSYEWWVHDAERGVRRKPMVMNITNTKRYRQKGSKGLSKNSKLHWTGPNVEIYPPSNSVTSKYTRNKRDGRKLDRTWLPADIQPMDVGKIHETRDRSKALVPPSCSILKARQRGLSISRESVALAGTYRGDLSKVRLGFESRSC